MASKAIRIPVMHQPVDPRLLGEAVTIRRATEILEASRVLAHVAEDHGLRIKVWHDISSQQEMTDTEGKNLNSSVFGWNPDGSELWQDFDRASSSQIIRACRVEGEPFWVNGDGFRTAVHNPFLDGIYLGDFDKLSTVKAAIIIPVHLPFGQISVAIICSYDRTKSDLSVEFADVGSLFSDLCRRFLTTYAATVRENPYLPNETVLTIREVECLRWAAFGKTDKEIAVILDWSHATIRYYVSRVCKKLGAVNRAQAIFRAAQLGYLGSHE